jgi:serine/threonine protein kinase
MSFNSSSGTASLRANGRPTLYSYYTLQEKLGQGSFGQVNACVHKETAMICAVKMIDLRGASGKVSKRRKTEVSQELTMWRRLNGHKHIVSLIDTFFTEEFSSFVMEKCECSLLGMMDANFEEGQLFSCIFPQMLLGLQHCHTKNCIHRDVKPTNFLLDSNRVVKLADFGCAIDRSQAPGGIVGTVPYMSPEMCEGFRHGFETDIWSFSASVYLLLYGRHPYAPKKPTMAESSQDKKEKKNAIMLAILSNNPKPRFTSATKWPYQRSSCAQRFVQAVLERDLAKRPDAGVCLELLEVYRASSSPCEECIEQPRRTFAVSFGQGDSLCAVHLITTCSSHEEKFCYGEILTTTDKMNPSGVSTMATSGEASLTSHKSRSRQALISL